MDGVTTLLSTSPHFPSVSKDFLAQSYHPSHSTPSTSTRKRKPVVTYQSPGSGAVDVGLLVRNTALEIEAAAARGMPLKAPAVTALAVTGPTSPAMVAEPAVAEDASAIVKVESTPQTTWVVAVHRPITIPRPPHPLYHPLSRSTTSKPAVKTSTGTSSSTSQLVPPTTEPGRRSSSRTRRPAPKMREAESMMNVSKVVPEKPSPAKRRRGPGAGKRRRGGAHVDVDGDAAYPASKRTRKARERVEVEVENETMPPPAVNGGSPPLGYSTRAKRPRKVATHTQAESSTSDGTGSATRTTPVNGHVEEFWVPTKTT